MGDRGIECLAEISSIIRKLRGDKGCPWDKKQTPDSVKTYIIEEAHEAVDAIRREKIDEIVEELGDLIFMIFFMIHLYEEKGLFSLEDVCRKVCDKMVRRHPHVFGTVEVKSADEVKDNWDKIKKLEGKDSRSGSEVPTTLPALIRAYRLISRGIVETEKKDVSHILNSVADDIRNGTCNGFLNEHFLGEVILKLVYAGKLCGIRAEDALHRLLDKIQNV